MKEKLADISKREILYSALILGKLILQFLDYFLPNFAVVSTLRAPYCKKDLSVLSETVYCKEHNKNQNNIVKFSWKKKSEITGQNLL